MILLKKASNIFCITQISVSYRKIICSGLGYAFAMYSREVLFSFKCNEHKFDYRMGVVPNLGDTVLCTSNINIFLYKNIIDKMQKSCKIVLK